MTDATNDDLRREAERLTNSASLGQLGQGGSEAVH
jgi:hypothetical protein